MRLPNWPAWEPLQRLRGHGFPEAISNFLGNPVKLMPIAAALLVLGIVALIPINTGGEATTRSIEKGPSSAIEGLGEEDPIAGVAEGEEIAPGQAPARKGRASATGSQGSSATSALAKPGQSQGVTDTEIAIGIGTLENYNQVIGSIGGGASNEGNRAQAQAIVNYINDNGGMAGRKVVPVYHAFDASSNESYDARGQAACATYTEDNKVFAATGVLNGRMTAVACLAKNNTPYIAGWADEDERFYQKYSDFLYVPNTMNFTRVARWYAEGLGQQGFFEPGARVGLLRYDRQEDKNAVEEGMKPALARQGVQLVEEVAVRYYRSTAELGPLSGEVSNAVLRFNTRAITHTLILDQGGVLALFFMSNAESQGYRPRYGANSLWTLVFQQENAPQEQLRRAMGVGWRPNYDVDFQREPPVNASKKLCLDILAKAGQKFANKIAQETALSYCDGLFFLKAGLDSANSPTTAGFRDSVEKFGTSFEAAQTFGTYFGPGRHDGTRILRHLVFNDQCKCFTYVGQPVSAE